MRHKLYALAQSLSPRKSAPTMYGGGYRSPPYDSSSFLNKKLWYIFSINDYSNKQINQRTICLLEFSLFVLILPIFNFFRT
jgi:hypothetical protein